MIFAILNPAAVLQEEHRLHILGLLIDSSEIVSESIVTDERLNAHIFPRILFPDFLPCRGKSGL